MKGKRKRKKIVLSDGERLCGELLTGLGLNPSSQYRISLIPRYRFDYYFTHEGREYILEFDGSQHFEFTPWFHRSKRSFYIKRRRDLLKSSVALMSGYHLIRIAYNDLVKAQDIIKTVIREKTRLYVSNKEKYSYLLTTKIPKKWFLKYGQHLHLFD